ncbi:hypothetical protein OG21DRAFT_1507644 [Imleria badia]|nr:hypothetical protein OG21DRAFT_1507644 [Imleria badia]
MQRAVQTGVGPPYGRDDCMTVKTAWKRTGYQVRTGETQERSGAVRTFHKIPNSITMRFSFFAILSGLAALVVVNASPAANVERSVSSGVICDCLRVCRPGVVISCCGGEKCPPPPPESE